MSIDGLLKRIIILLIVAIIASVSVIPAANAEGSFARLGGQNKLLLSTRSAPLSSAYSVTLTPAQTEVLEYLKGKNAASSETFAPTKFISKGLFAKWLLLAEGFTPSSETKSRTTFEDVPLNSTYAPFIYQLLELDAIPYPESKKFFPNAPLRLVEALKILFAVEGIAAPKIFPDAEWTFSKLKKNAAYAPYLHMAWKKRLTDASKNVFPFSPLTQEKAGSMIRQLLENRNIPTLTINLEDASKNSDIGKNVKFPLLEDAYQRIQRSYLHKDRLNENDMVYGGIDGLVKSLGDTHSEFTKPSQDSVLTSLSGDLEGIGAVIQATEDGKIVIVSPVKKSPAEAAGLLPNDIVLEVDGLSMKGLTVSQAAQKIRGPSGTEVKLKIQRDDKTLEFTITRAKIHVPSSELKFTDENIAVVTINNFGAALNIEFMKIVAEINKKSPRGIILDLRNNPGGYLDIAVAIAGFFVEQGNVVAKIRYPDRVEDQISQGSGILKKYPVRVLVNKGSASASEILAGALQDHQVGKVIGEKSFGKGTVQELTTYNDGSTLKITVAEWLTPKGRSIEKVGVMPDIEVKRTDEDIRNNRDPQLNQALQELR